MITREQYEEISGRNTIHNAWVDSIRSRNGWASYKPEDKPAHIPDVTNEERSQLEVYEFVNKPPVRYFLYVNEEMRTATTWTGDLLGVVSFGREWCDSFGGKRVSITIRGINRKNYHGTYYKSSGNYARVKMYR